MTFTRWFITAQAAVRCAITKWWRPLTCVGIAGSIWVNGVVLPLWHGTPVEGGGFAAMIAAATAAFAVREWGKAQGTAAD